MGDVRKWRSLVGDELLADIVNYGVSVLLPVLLVLGVAEILELHLAAAYVHLPLQGYQEAGFLHQRLILRVLILSLTEVIIKIGICSNPTLPEVAEQLHLLLRHVTV